MAINLFSIFQRAFTSALGTAEDAPYILGSPFARCTLSIVDDFLGRIFYLKNYCPSIIQRITYEDTRDMESSQLCLRKDSVRAFLPCSPRGWGGEYSVVRKDIQKILMQS